MVSSTVTEDTKHRDFDAVLEQLAFLWGFTVSLDEVDARGEVRNLGAKVGEKRRK